MKKIIFLLGILFCFGIANAGIPPDSSFTDIYHFGTPVNISDETYIFSSPANKNINQLHDAQFIKLNDFSEKDHIGIASVTNTFFLAFNLWNSGHSAKKFWYYIGTIMQDVDVYKKSVMGKYEIDPEIRRRGDFILLELNGGEKAAFFIRTKFFKLKYNKFKSVVIADENLEEYKAGINLPYFARNTGLGLLSGMLLLMSLLTIVDFIINKRPEFIYNFLYTACMFFLLFFTAFITRTSGIPRGYFFGYFDLLLLATGSFGYLQFAKVFLKELMPRAKLIRFLRFEQVLLIVMMALYTVLHFFTNTFAPQEWVEMIMKIFLIVCGLIYTLVTFSYRNRFMNYLAAGTALQLLFSVLSLVLIVVHLPIISILSSGTFFFGIGVIASVIFYLLGLTYSNRVSLIEQIREREFLKASAEKKELEKKLEIITARQKERSRISADMHDDLGAGMTAIRLYSELALSKMGDRKIPEIQKISASANELLNNMNAIIWSMSSSNDSLTNMLAYIRSYAINYFEDTDIKCVITLPEFIPDIVVSGGIRRNVFLITKEALHNVLKHSGATRLELNLTISKEIISFTIHDNGKGFDCDGDNGFRNGLKNMKQRAQYIAVSFEIENRNGTLITMTRPLIVL